jgi:hypothetical protein
MINRNIEEITKDDLQALVDNKVIEHKTIEYKRELPGGSEKEKKEFLADITSFANASGGDIIYGLAEEKETGKPKSLDGLTLENPPEEILKLEGIIINGVQPRIPSVICSKPIPIKDDKIALVIRVQKSWISPHRVILGGHDKFYSRSSNGKYPLDVGELRMAFNLSETLSERVRNFRTDRIAKIIADDTPVSVNNKAKLSLHLVPIISFNPAQYYDISIIASKPERMAPIHGFGWSHRYNLDGFLTYSQDREGKVWTYVQLFKSGIIEAVDTSLLDNGCKIFSTYEEQLVKSFSIYLSILKNINVEPPIFVFLNMFGVKGYSMGLPEQVRTHDTFPIDRDMLFLPESIVERYDVKAEEVLKPSFDSVWNACGFKRSLNYNEQGEWAPKQ